jgi:hypothetical protein
MKYSTYLAHILDQNYGLFIYLIIYSLLIYLMKLQISKTALNSTIITE